MTVVSRPVPAARAPLVPRFPWRWGFVMLLGAAILCTVGAFNRGPFYFYDTIGYLRTASQGLNRVLGLPATAPAHPERNAANPAPATGEDANVKWGNRSIYYGTVLAIADRLNAMALVPLAQGLLAAWIVLLVWKRLGPRECGPWGYAALCAGLVLLTPLGFYVAYLMPDLFFGLLILAVPLLLLEGERLGHWEQAGLLFFLLVAALSHAALLMMLGGLIVIGLVVVRLVAHVPLRGAVAAGMIGAAVLGLAGHWAVGKLTERVFGQPALWPPFVLARVLADGPGTLYLRDACAANPDRFVLCRYLGDLPPASADEFLWNLEGPMWRASNAEQRRMIREQWSVVIPAVLAHSGLQIRVSASNIARQLILNGVEEFAWDDHTRRGIAELFPRQMPTLMHTRVAGTGVGWTRPLNLLHGGVLLISILVVVTRLFFTWRSVDPGCPRRESAWLLMVLAGVLLNGVISGALSEPHARYGARVIWVVPMAAAIVLIRAWVARARQLRRAGGRHPLVPPEKA